MYEIVIPSAVDQQSIGFPKNVRLEELRIQPAQLDQESCKTALVQFFTSCTENSLQGLVKLLSAAVPTRFLVGADGEVWLEVACARKFLYVWCHEYNGTVESQDPVFREYFRFFSGLSLNLSPDAGHFLRSLNLKLSAFGFEGATAKKWNSSPVVFHGETGDLLVMNGQKFAWARITGEIVEVKGGFKNIVEAFSMFLQSDAPFFDSYYLPT